MRENRDKIIAFVIKEEVNPGEEMTGSYHCAKDDRGGCTKFGIAQANHPNIDIENLTREGAIQLYIDEYWTPIEGDDLPSGVDLMVMDFAVTSGPRRAQGAYYQVLGTNVTGTDLIHPYASYRKEYYNHIVSADPIQQKFLLDWLKRVDQATAAAIVLKG
jgi:lysozyme family protein